MSPLLAAAFAICIQHSTPAQQFTMDGLMLAAEWDDGYSVCHAVQVDVLNAHFNQEQEDRDAHLSLNPQYVKDMEIISKALRERP